MPQNTWVQTSIYIIMGVSGSGKTTVGQLLAQHLSLKFLDADDFHPSENVKKMHTGIPLTDQDRSGWLRALNIKIAAQIKANKGCVIACSALKSAYRDLLSANTQGQITWVYLKGDFDTISKRIQSRKGHFMPLSLLMSQFDLLEEPTDAITINIEQDPDGIIREITNKTMMPTSEFGLVGLGVMGKSLSRNLAQKGVRLSLFNRHETGTEEKVAETFISEFEELSQAQGFDDLRAFVCSIAAPRKVFLMIQAGKPTDDFLQKIIPFLSGGDVIIDGGNSHYTDTKRRMDTLAAHQIGFIGTGVSGGEAGALNGPSIMPSGNPNDYALVKPFLEAIAAKDVSGKPCCAYMGPDGSGHFIKMVHNGIEYAEMQLIAEVYACLRYINGHTPDQIANILEEWSQTELSSYLLSITVDILRKKEGDNSLIDYILDKAGNKGTGNWATVAAAELGMPATMIGAALFARYTSSVRTQNLYSRSIKGVDYITLNSIKNAYSAARLLNHYQGFELIRAASSEFKWGVKLPEIARIWTNGCIIRSALMEELATILQKDVHLLSEKSIQDRLHHTYQDLVNVGMDMAKAGISIPCHLAALDFLNAHTHYLPTAHIIQAQRDYFGAHTYQRNDDDSGTFHHTIW